MPFRGSWSTPSEGGSTGLGRGAFWERKSGRAGRDLNTLSRLIGDREPVIYFEQRIHQVAA